MRFLKQNLAGIVLIMSIFLLTMCDTNEQPGGGKASPEGKKAESGELMKRSEIDQKYKWDLTDIYESEDEWEADYKAAAEMVDEYSNFEGKLGNSAETLLDYLNFDREISNRLRKLYQFASLSKDLNLKETKYQGMFERIQNLQNKVETAKAFVRPEILSIGNDKLKSYISKNKSLQHFNHYFDNMLRFEPYTLSKSEEKILALAGSVEETFMKNYRLYTGADMEYPSVKDPEGNEIEMSPARYYSAMNSEDRAYRKRAYKAIYVPFTNSLNFLTSNYNGSIKANIFEAESRGFENTLEAALFRNNIPVEVYTNLVETVNKNLQPLQRWGELKKEVLGLEELHPYDVYVSLFPSVQKQYSPDDAMEILLEALNPLGDQYIKDLKYAFENNWVDFYETENKRAGAYSTGAVKGIHPYVLMNWGYTLTDVFTLAHEMGHNIHSWYTANNQEYPYDDYPIFVAEVASITNEILLLNYLINNAESKEEKMALIETELNRIKSTFYRQTRFAEFEMVAQKKIEEGAAITPDKYAELFGNMYQKYWGDDMVVDEEEKNSWPRIHHFYYNFYVYQYATSMAAAQAVAQQILDEGQPAIDRYLNFLRSGRSKYAIETLEDAGVDMTQPEPILAVIEKSKTLLDELDKLLKEK